MTHPSLTSNPSDISLLLRVYGEQRWLMREVVPVLREAERPGAVAEQDLGAAMAYLEMLWSQARRLANETDTAAALLEDDDPRCCSALIEKALRYHSAITRLRGAVAARVERLTRASLGPSLSAEPAG